MPMGKDALDAKLPDTEGVPQLSVAVGGVHVAVAVVPEVVTLIFVGQLLKTGGVASVAQGSKRETTTLKRHSDTLFLASLAV